jgi:transposase
MLQAIIEGETDPTALAELAHGRMRSKRAALEQALTGRLRQHHRYLLAQHLLHLDFLDEQIEELDQQLARMIALEPPVEESPGDSAGSGPHPEEAEGGTGAGAGSVMSWAEAIEVLDTIPGVGRLAAEQIVAEIGTDMGRFQSAAHLASWAKVCPGNDESAGKRRAAKTGQANRWLRSVLVQAAWAAVRVKESHLARVYHRLAGRRGVKRAIMAVAHRILVAAYYMLRDRVPYQEPGAPPADEQRKAQVLSRMLKRIEKLGYTVSLEPTGAAAT